MKKLLLALMFVISSYAGIDLNDIKADFIQTIYKDQASITYTGTLYFKDNNNLWIYKTPSNKKVYLSQDNLTIVEDELEQVIIQKLKDKINITKILHNAKKQPNGHYEAIHDDIAYDISPSNTQILIHYHDTDHNQVSLKLHNIAKNQNLTNEIFIPSYDSSYDIVR